MRPAGWPPSKTAALRVEVAGQIVPLDKCDWVFRRPCGCSCGVLVAREVPTEEDAWKDFYPKRRDREKIRAQGFTFELVTHERWCSELADSFLDECDKCRKPKKPKATDLFTEETEAVPTKEGLL